MVDNPLLAYKYTDSDPHGEDDVNTTILGKACEAYLDCYIDMQNKLKKAFCQSCPIEQSASFETN